MGGRTAQRSAEAPAAAPPPAHSAAAYLPPRRTLTSLRSAASHCQGCDLYRNATQTVFGIGAEKARIVLLGEQPGDEEDRSGLPFVGPAGRLLDEALQEARIDRNACYITNVVKHFKWSPRGKRRLHGKPNAAEIRACSPWLQEELRLLDPVIVVCLGATAAQALLGRSFRVTTQHGRVLESALAPRVLATLHPSAVLRQRAPDARARARAQLVSDLRVAATQL